MGRATNTELQLPASDPFVRAGQTSTVTSETHYNIDGTLKQTTDPALGGLPSEIVGYKHDDLGNLTAIGTYLPEIDYSALAKPLLLTMGTDDDRVYVANRFEDGTDRLTQTFTQDHTHPYHLQELNYSYDQAGNVTSISDPTTLGGTSSPETQCFTYDAHQRLTEAWTPTTQNCTDTRNASALSGPAPYWTSYTYNPAGQRTTETQHTSTATTKITYCYTNTNQPHTLTGTTTKTDCTNPERTYSYDATGNTTKRPGTAGNTAQNLIWSEEGKLTRLTEDDQPTDYVYGADGTLLIRATEDGERVLYAGATELHLRTDGTTWAQRYYTAGGITAGMRSNQTGTNKVTFLISDHHGTSSLAVDRLDQKFTKRYTTPFGEDRGKPLYGPWPDDKGFLGKTRDITTGLTHIGAREYDPVIGQFISVDPLLESIRSQTLNGYSYGAQNPLLFSDPSGLGLACGGAGGSSEACPRRPDGSRGNGQPNEAVDYSKPAPPHPCNGAYCGESSETEEIYSYNFLVEGPEAIKAPVRNRYEVNGVCVWAAASSCGTGSAAGSAPQMADLNCESGDTACKLRQELLNLGIQTGMTGGSVGFFALRPRGSWVRVTGVPEGVNLSQLAAIRKAFDKDLGFPAEVSIQGSRASGNTGGRSDVDIAVRVSPETFDALVAKRWPSANPGSSKARTRDHAIATGKINSGDVRPRLSGISKEIFNIMRDEVVDHVDVSVIRIGGPFDEGPFVRVK